MDDAYIGGVHPGKHGRGAAGKVMILVAAEAKGCGMGRIRLAQVADGSAVQMEAFVRSAVGAGAGIVTDGNRSYNGLRALGYRHAVSPMHEAAGREEKMLPRAHRVVALLKRWLLGIHQGAVSQAHLPYYLDEYTFRFNRRTSRHRGKLFFRLLQQAMVISPATYSHVVNPIRSRRHLKLHHP